MSSHNREGWMSMYLRQTAYNNIPRLRGPSRWDIVGPTLLAVAFALSTALIFLE